ncbi:hypothetical protein EYF80_004364 [Liparis tanakae]|uniref:Uncharacterized protein n=1 Tax=Liparis tanakae TaxID=230148 RepID=A0A4Z2J7C5_9TELE|nr:hypothetical protein EYF80_004364 [Liparis tanakae]
MYRPHARPQRCDTRLWYSQDAYEPDSTGVARAQILAVNSQISLSFTQIRHPPTQAKPLDTALHLCPAVIGYLQEEEEEEGEEEAEEEGVRWGLSGRRTSEREGRDSSERPLVRFSKLGCARSTEYARAPRGHQRQSRAALTML